MARTIKAGFGGADVAELRQDLESVRLGLGRQLVTALRASGPAIAAATAERIPVGPGPSKVGRRVGGMTLPPKDNLPHMNTTIGFGVRGASILIGTDHPGGPVLEHGGEISPRGTPITIRKHEMAQKAGEAQLDRVERDVTQRINALLAQHGLSS